MLARKLTTRDVSGRGTLIPDPTLTLVGDLMLGGDFSARADRYLGSAVPAELRDYMRADIVLANLEAGFSRRGEPTPNKILVYALEEAAPFLDEIGISAVSLANNHIFDYGLKGVQDTIAVLRAMGIGSFGAGRNLEEASRPWVTQAGSKSVAVVGFSWTSEWVQPAPAATKDSPGVNPLNTANVEHTLTRATQTYEPDVLVVSIHWGEGMSTWPRPDAISQARALLALGANVVWGHHPHCLQPYERLSGGTVFYSLGNFLASTYEKSPDMRLTYEGGELRTRTERERLTVAVRLSLDSWEGDYMPLVQDKTTPVLARASSSQARRIASVFEGRSKYLASPLYRARYALVRRWDEIVSKLQAVREEGLKDLTWRTPFRAIRRLATGRNMH